MMKFRQSVDSGRYLLINRVELISIILACIFIVLTPNTGKGEEEKEHKFFLTLDDRIVTNKLENQGLSISLQTTKKLYKNNKKVEILVLIENKETINPYYIGWRFFDLFYKYNLELRNSHKEKIELIEFAGDPAINFKQPILKETLHDSFILLHPEKIFGFKWTIDLKLRPGNYEAVVTYADRLSPWYTVNQIEGSHYKIWRKPLRSNSVSIKVVK